MTDITLRIERDDDLRLLLDLIRRLGLPIIRTSVLEYNESNIDKQKMIDFVLSYQNDNPSFGDAAVWQTQERADSIVSASAVLNNAELYTRNIADFKNVPNLRIVNPIV